MVQSYLGRHLHTPEDVVRRIIMTVITTTKYNDAEAAETLYRSLQRVKSQDINDCPLFKVCKWMEKRRDFGTYIKQRSELMRRIAKDVGVSEGSVKGVIARHPFKLPDHLLPRKKKIKKTPMTPSQTSTVVEAPKSVQIKNQGCEEITIETPNATITIKFKGS